MMNSTLAYLDHLAEESRRFEQVLRQTDPAARVPTCADWTSDDLLWHLTEVQAFWAGVIEGPVTDDAGVRAVEEAKPERPADRDELRSLFTSTSERLLAGLSGRDRTTPAWSWHEPDQTVGFTMRRQAHEALIHRVDAELTAGVPVLPLDADLADDGVDEVLRVMWGVPSWATFYPGDGAVRLLSTDTGRTRLLQPGRFVGTGPQSGTEFDEPTAVLAEDDSPEPLAEVVGTAAALDRWLWGRGTDGVRRSGDDSVLLCLDEVVAIGMQ